MPISIERFHPPSFTLSAELRWVLARAFGPCDGSPPSGPLELQVAIEVAGALQLASRIASRQPEGRLAAEVGGELALLLQRRRRQDAARETAIDAGLGRVASHLDAHRLPFAPLKLAALMRGGYLAAGSRGGADVDILVPRSRISELREVLLKEGYRQSALGEPEHQLPSFFDPTGCMVEVHLVVLGVRIAESRRSAGYENLDRSGLLQSCEGPQGVLSMPKREVLAAHALAHGLAQHGARPGDYPLFRMVADLQDLGATGSEGDPVLAPVPAWLERTVKPDLVAAVAELIRCLSGPDPLPAEGPWLHSPAGILLRHFAAAALEPRYRRALALAVLEPRLSDHGAAWVLSSTLFRALYPSRAALAALYGPNRSWPRLLGQRLWRPIDLAVRLVRALRARLGRDRSWGRDA